MQCTVDEKFSDSTWQNVLGLCILALKMPTCSIRENMLIWVSWHTQKSPCVEQERLWGEKTVIGLLCILEVKMTWRSVHHLKIALFPGWKAVLWTLNQMLYSLHTQNHLNLLYVEDFPISLQCWEQAGLVTQNVKHMDCFCERKALHLLQRDRGKRKNEPQQYSDPCYI